jgi:hypothetical protein
MYTLSEQQLEFILRDIKSRGVEMEDLQISLLDHICCIIECELEPDGDFESFYRKTIPRFFKKELREIEEETILLLTFKNYYAMRKTMIITGTTSVVGFTIGSFLKIMHWPGANVLLLLGITVASLVFLPLLFILKTKEANSGRDKIVLGVGTFFGMLISLATLFKVLHWPWANNMWLASLGILFFIFLPLYFFTGIRNPETKINTITSSMLILFAGGLLFTLTNLRPSKVVVKNNMEAYIQSEELLKRMQSNVKDSITSSALYAEIFGDCQKIKELILQDETGLKSVPANRGDDYEAIFFPEGGLGQEFYDGGEGAQLLSDLKTAVVKFNGSNSSAQIPVSHSVLDIDMSKIGQHTNLSVLNSMVRIQMFLASAGK